MKLLKIEDLNEIAGGNTTISVTVDVPGADINNLALLLGELLTNQLDAATLAAALSNSPANFNEMIVKSITINNFTITANP